MQRPQKMVFNIEHIGPNEIDQIANAIGDAHMIAVGEVRVPFVDPKQQDRYRNEYFEPVMVVMTEALFYSVMKHPHSDIYLNRYDYMSPHWTFYGLPVAIIRNMNGKTNEQWSQIV